MGLATMLSPLLTTGTHAVIGSTTSKSSSTSRGSGAGAAPAEDRHRRAVDRRDGPHPRGPAQPHEEHHHVKYTDTALETRRSSPRGTFANSRPRQCDRRHRRSGAVTRLKRGRCPRTTSVTVDRRRDRSRRRADGADSARQASSSDLRAFEDARRVARARVCSASMRQCIWWRRPSNGARAGSGARGAAGCFLFTARRCRQDRAGEQLALLLGNEFIRFDMSGVLEKHGGRAAHRRAARIRRFEQGGQLVDAVRTPSL